MSEKIEKPPVYDGPFEIVQRLPGNNYATVLDGEVIGIAVSMAAARTICNALNLVQSPRREYVFRPPRTREGRSDEP